jgi:hypothetical protein
MSKVAKELGLLIAYEIWQYIVRLLIRMSPAGMSSEDSGVEDGVPVLHCSQMKWRRKLDNIFNLVDNATMRNPGCFHRNSSLKLLRLRGPQNRTSQRDPPHGYPSVLYDPVWTADQTAGFLQSLQIKDTTFVYNEVYEANALTLGAIKTH